MSIIAELSGASLDLGPTTPEAGLGAGPHPFDAREGARLREGVVLGRGGLGEVRSARDARLQRDIAVKAALDPSPASQRQLSREAWITARLEHPGIIPIYDAGRRADGTLYYAMRRVRGRSLADALAAIDAGRDSSERQRLIRRFLDACEALAFAHSRGVVHRDVKPANILIGDYGETLVADWGLACYMPGREPPDLPPEALARETKVVGTRGFMAPEQARAEAPDPRADVFSLGVTLARLVERGPAELQSVARRASACQPSARYPEAGALARDIERWLDGERVEAHHYTLGQRLARFARRRARTLAVAAVALFVIIIVTTFGVIRTGRERDRAQSAELDARTQHQRAEHNLGRALVARALDAAADGRRAEAEMAAVHALALYDSPEARGVLAQFGVSARPRSARRSRIPACDLAKLDPSGQLRVCLDDKRLVIRELDTERGHERALPGDALLVDDAVLLGPSRAVLLVAAEVDDEDAIAAWYWDGREVLEKVEAIRQTRGLAGGPDSERAVLVANGKYLRLTPTAVDAVERPCGASIGLAGAIGSLGREALACADGRILSVEPEGHVSVLATLPVTDGPPLSLAWDTGGPRPHLAVGTTAGWVSVIDPGRGAIDRRFRASNRPIRALSLRGQRCAVLGEDGRLSAWFLDTDTPTSTSLPGRALALGFLASGELRVIGRDYVEDWVISDRPTPPLRASDEGIAAIEPLGQGRVATAHGDGSLRLWSAVGTNTRQIRFEGGVVKDISADSSGAIAVAAIARPGVVVLDPGLTERDFVSGLRCRRIAWLDPDTILALPYGPELRRLTRQPGAGWSVTDIAIDPRLRDLSAFPEGGAAWTLSQTGWTWAVPANSDATIESGPRLLDATCIAGNDERVYGGTRGTLISIAADGSDSIEVHVDSMVWDLALSDAHRVLASGHADGTIELRDAGTLELLTVLRGHQARVSALRFELGSERVWSGSWDGDARVWSLTPVRADAHTLLGEIEQTWRRELGDLLD